MVKRHWSRQEDAALQQLQARGVPARQIGALLGRTKQACHARAALLRRGAQRLPWSPAEDALIRDTASYRTCIDLARELGRTPQAVNSRACSLGIRWNVPARGHAHTGLTASAVARLLGVPCSKRVVWWIEQGYLVGTRRAARLPERGGRTPRVGWRIMSDALRAFLRDYPWLYERQRIVDPGWSAYVATLPREEWLSVGAAAPLLYLTKAGVNLAIRKGDIRAEKRGPNWLVPLSAIRAYVPPPLGGSCVRDEVAARRVRNLAARKTTSYRADPATVAAQVCGRAATRLAGC